MITIHESSGRSGKVRVTFSMPASVCCDGLYLVGWFGEWDESVFRMERAPDGSWSLTMELEAGCEYLYRFRTLSGQWITDPEVSPAPAQFGPKNAFVLNNATMV